MKRIILMLTVAALMVAALTVSAAGAFAAQALPEGCSKDQGKITCTSGPGKNQGGVGSTTTSQGNLTNKQQSSCRPANASFCQ
jgi:Spy/CpxP family protein refolding chaperone